VLENDIYSQRVSARLLDFFGFNTTWQRRLWDVGSVLGLEETLEASEAVRDGVLSPDTLRHLCGSMKRVAGRDPAVSELPNHALIQQCLSSDFVFEGHEFRVLKQQVTSVQSNYLSRWAGVVSDSVRRPGPDRTAAAIASHMLDRELSPAYLHRWWSYRIFHEAGERTLEELVNEAGELLQAGPKKLEVLVAFERAPGAKPDMPAEWRDERSVAKWLKGHVGSTEGIRQRGGLVVEVDAWDPWAAVERAVEVVDRVSARVALTARKPLKEIENAWVEGRKESFPLRRFPRGMEVPSLETTARLYATTSESPVDSALELLEPLDKGPPGPAVSGGWAAIESLLVGPGDRGKVVAGERLAALVACSYPRAELTTLAYAYAKQHEDDLAEQIREAESNRKRAELIQSAIQNGRNLVFAHAADDAGHQRMVDLHGEPRQTLAKVESYVDLAVRRLYRQRNLVLHGGRVAGIALRASLRTAAPLVGAGMDRIVHAWFERRQGPQELAALAKTRLAVLGTPMGRAVTSLLE
jgi:hypothetical protein